jgi:hypothetical protein
MASRPGYSGADDLGRRRADRKEFSPSTDWAHGGPIIERERITLEEHAGEWCAYVRMQWGPGAMPEGSDGVGYGPTPLIAAMRAFVASKR